MQVGAQTGTRPKSNDLPSKHQEQFGTRSKTAQLPGPVLVLTNHIGLI